MSTDPGTADKRMVPVPPQVLSKETVGVWTGWCSLGDKEVAREAAAKGLHVRLAITFLAARRKLSFEHARIWFNAEIIKWVMELLERRQIHKTTYLLSNIGLDPIAEFTRIFRSTYDLGMRDYMGNHLIQIEKMDENLWRLWDLLKAILANLKFLASYRLVQYSIGSIEAQSETWRADVAAILLRQTNDFKLTYFLRSESFWRHLVAHNDFRSLQTWLNVQFNSDFNPKEYTDCNIIEAFRKLPLTKEVVYLNIDLLMPAKLHKAIYDELSKFGIFSHEEKSDLLAILQRLRNSYSIGNLFKILSSNSSVISPSNFFKLLIDYCLNQELYSILNVCVEDFNLDSNDSTMHPHLQLIRNFRLLSRDFTEDNLHINIFKVAGFLSHDVVTYFNDNPLMLLALILFAKDFNISNMDTENGILLVEGVELTDPFFNSIEAFPMLDSVYDRMDNRAPKCTLSMYDLIKIHLKASPAKFFEFRLKNSEMPHFTTTDIVKKWGYSKRIGYKFYLKQLRPSIAACILFAKYRLSEIRSSIKEELVNQVQRKVIKLAVSDFQNEELGASCVAFLEMIGVNSQKLRVLLGSTRVLYRAHHSKETVVEAVSKSDDDPNSLQNLLEVALIGEIETIPITSSKELLHAFRTYNIVIQYSRLMDIKLPDLILRHFAGNNLWLPFLIFAQMHNYPLEQVKLVIQFFKSPNMLEHLTHGVVTDIWGALRNVQIKEKDARRYFVGRVAVRKASDIVEHNLSQSLMSQSSSEESSPGSDFFDFDLVNIKATLAQTLIRCHDSTDPPKALLQACQLYRNPLLAIFASSYEPDSVVTHWLTWLAVSSELCQPFTNYETVAASPGDVAKLMQDCIENGYHLTVLESLEIFLPDNPLRQFLDFLNDCINLDFDVAILMQKLKEFGLRSARKHSVLPETDHELTYLTGRFWIESTALKLLTVVINQCKSLHEQIRTVEVLIQVQIWKYFGIEPARFHNLLSVLQALSEINPDVKLDVIAIFDEQTSRQAVVSCINCLLDRQDFKTAYKIAQIEDLPIDIIVVKDWQSRFDDRDSHFWAKCDEDFTSSNVTADCVIEFYTDCLDKVTDLHEKFTVLNLTWQWAAKYELSCQYTVERQMWLAFFYLDERHKDVEVFDIKPNSFLYGDLVERLKNVPECDEEFNKDLVRQVERLIVYTLNRGDFWLGLRLQKMFACKNADLETLKLAYSLAENLIQPDQLTNEQRLLLSNVKNVGALHRKRTFLSTRLSSISSASHSSANLTPSNAPEPVDSVNHDVLAALSLLCERLHNGLGIGKRIFMAFRISINIEIPYQLVIMAEDYMKMLTDALGDNCANKLDVVRDFIQVYPWTKADIAGFICDQLISATLRSIESNLESIILWDLDVDQQFPLVLQELQDGCSLLGHRIYSYTLNFYKSRIECSGGDFEINDFLLVIELLIRAHDSFTTDCNMEGISMVLKKSKEVVANLLVLQDWRLIVRLLTGVARYSEMDYVFQILIDNDQFEYLLRKTIRKDNSLKVALLDYLKKFCPENRDLYKIVALHFALFSEVAILWETEAQMVIKNLITISKLEMQNEGLDPEQEPFVLFQNIEGTQICLKKAMENYKHATEFHLQGDQLTKALEASKQAELVALQIGMLNQVPMKNSVPCLLNITNTQITQLISTKLAFEQSLVVVEAYRYHADWSTVLYEQYVVKDDEGFLESFRQHFPITDSLTQDIAKKFAGPALSGRNVVSEIKCMKKLLTYLPSVHIKYKIASELGFTDLVEDLIENGELVYLKDTVWKRGYRS